MRNNWSETGFHPRRKNNPGLTDLIASHIPRGSKLLDVGCCDGSLYSHCLSRGHDYLGVDLSENEIAEARAEGISARKIDDASHLPFPNATFDAALCLEILEHLFQPQLAANEIIRVLRPGGVLIATVPNAASRRIEICTERWNPTSDALSVEQPWRDPHLRFLYRDIAAENVDPRRVRVGQSERPLYGIRWVCEGREWF